MTDLPAIDDEVRAEVSTLERELSEIDMLIAQARNEVERHEQKRAQAEEKFTALSGKPSEQKDIVDASTHFIALTRRTALMQAQVEILEGKRKALGRFHEAMLRQAGSPRHDSDLDAGEGTTGEAAASDDDVAAGPLPLAMSRVVLSAQEDLRREIARAMHDGPAQSLTNIVLQAQIVERLMDRDPELAKGEVKLLVGMVQQTLDATKSFIFDVRPMVLDDLGLVPTLRRAARDRGRRAGIAVDFESRGADRRLPVELESGLFRILDEALAAYLSIAPDSIGLRLDWADRVEATVTARRSIEAVVPAAPVPENEPRRRGRGDKGDKGEKELPPALAAMVEDRREAERERVEQKRVGALAALPVEAWREIQQRATTIGVSAELFDEGATLRVRATPPEASGTTTG